MHRPLARKPRVLQLVTHDRLGGVRTLVGMVEAGLAAEGFEVDTLALSSERGRLTTIADLARVAHAIFAGGYEALLTYQAAASVYGNLLGWLRRVPVRAAHQTAAPEGIRPHWRAIDRLFGTIGVYTHLVSNSSATSASFAGWPRAYRERFVLIPHGVDPLPRPAAAADWRMRLGIAPDVTVLVASGRMVAQKNHATAIRALPKLPGMHLVIAGDGPDQPQLAALARELGVDARLHFAGPVRRDDLGGLLAAADIYLFPSVWETFGLAGVEAAMAGLPVVAADLPVLREVLDLGPPGLVRFHAPQDSAGLAAAVMAMQATLPSAEQRAEFAARHVARHSRTRMIGQYAGFLGRLRVR